MGVCVLNLLTIIKFTIIKIYDYYMTTALNGLKLIAAENKSSEW